MTTVAVVGLGRMGGPMAGHILAAGFPTAVFDVSPVALDAYATSRARIATSPADAGTDAAVACVVVFDDEQAISVVAGAGGLLSTMPSGSVIAIHSTVSAGTIRSLHAHGIDRGIDVLDAGISGGETGAAAGTLVTMVGGSASAVEIARPVFSAFSKEVIHAGDLGSGLALKLARNATGYVCMSAVHEALQIAVAAGVDPDVLRHTLAETGVFDQALSPFMLGGPAPLPDDAAESMRELLTHLRALGEKDLDQALDLAGELRQTVPVIEATRRSFHSVTRL